MTSIPSPVVNFGQYGNTGTIDISKFTRTGSANTDPNSFALMLAQNMNPFDILFGDENSSNSSSILGQQSFFNTFPNTSSSLTGGNSSGINFPSDLGGVATGFNGVSAQYEMIARSNLIGKTVEAVEPGTHKTFTGKVEGVSVAGGILLINVGGTDVPPENLINVK
jgi:hypothetical protein